MQIYKQLPPPCCVNNDYISNSYKLILKYLFNKKSSLYAQSESGRSLVEMLGVLAIMGILTIGGIAGFNYAMNKHRANELLQQASFRALSVSTQLQTGMTPSLREFSQNQFSGGTFSDTVSVDNNSFTLTITGVSAAVCEQITRMQPQNILLSDCSDTEEMDVLLTYAASLGEPVASDEIPDCGGHAIGWADTCSGKPECTGCYIEGAGGVCNSAGKCVNPCPHNWRLWTDFSGEICGSQTPAPDMGIDCDEQRPGFLGYRYDLRSKTYFCAYCLTGDTMITLADGTCKRLDQIMPGDRVLCINPETGQLDIDEVTLSDALEHKEHTEYDVWTFSDNTVIKTIYRHRFYNIEQQRMVYMDEWKPGEHAYTRDGAAVSLIRHEHIVENVRHYTLFTKKWNNYFANNLLSGNRHTPTMILSARR